MAKISIKAKQGVYLTYRNYTYTAAQVFGEFIDNAIQSNEDHKNQLKSMTPNHQLRVDISVEWYQDPNDKIVKAKSISIQDNAAGMTSDLFAHAFNLADDEVTRKGMNEFGIGMKAASAWLGNKWRVETTSIVDNITRILEVNLTDVAKNQIEELDSLEITDPLRKHGTIISISELWPENVIKKDSVGDLIKNIASIYRYFIRNNEIRIYFEEQLLTFEEYNVLKAPSYKDPDGEEIEWKKSVSIDDHNGHTISGFVALLKDMSDEKRGVVFTRNNRVVLGFDPKDRTVGKDFIGQIGSRKYRRVFGELEISGFSVAFGKNKLNDMDLLEALCKGVAGKLKINGASLLTQADKYKAKAGKKPVPPTPPAPAPIPPVPAPPAPVPPTPPVPVPPTPPTPPTPTPPTPTPPTPVPHDDKLDEGNFSINGVDYSVEVIRGTESDEVFWNDLSQIINKKLICKINTKHPFFVKYGQPTQSIIYLFKALSIAKFKSMSHGSGKISDMMNEFNAIINTFK